MNDFEASWFKDRQKRYQRYDERGDLLAHRFFDAELGFSKKKQEINFVAVTPAGSEFRYQMDTISGQPYLKEPFCRGKDISFLRGPDFFLPPYHEGVVPQMLDHKLVPQRIIVFGADRLIQSYYQEAYFSTKILGGIVLKKCLSREACLNNYIEKKELILVAVSKDDPKLKTVSSLKELKKYIQWPTILSHLINAEGVFFYKDAFVPVVKSYQEFSGKKALAWMKNNNKLFNRKITTKLKKECQSIHRTIENILKTGDPTKGIKKLQSFFAKVTKYNSLCTRFVQAMDPRVNHRLHDFYNSMYLPFLLSFSDNYYHCDKKEWRSPSGREKEKALTALKMSFRKCSSNSFWELTQMAAPFSESLKNNDRPYWRYIGYDNISGGSHRRIDSWVFEPGTFLSCNKKLVPVLRKRKRIYPKKVERDLFKVFK